MKATIIQFQGIDDSRPHVLPDLQPRDPHAATISNLSLALTPAQLAQLSDDPARLFTGLSLSADDCIGWIISDRVAANEPLQAALVTALRSLMPAIPWTTLEKLDEIDYLNQFISTLGAVHEFRCLLADKLTPRALLDFHSRYKMVFLAHSQPAYRQLGPMLADLSRYPCLLPCALNYQRQFMQLLQNPATIANHTNVLMHLQGYFRDHLPEAGRQLLHQLILQYHQEKQPLQRVILQMKASLQTDAHPWLLAQRYLFPWLIGRDNMTVVQQERK